MKFGLKRITGQATKNQIVTSCMGNMDLGQTGWSLVETSEAYFDFSDGLRIW